jgi:hypothetical protein
MKRWTKNVKTVNPSLKNRKLFWIKGIDRLTDLVVNSSIFSRNRKKDVEYIKICHYQ